MQTKSEALSLDESRINDVPNAPCSKGIEPTLRLLLAVCFVLFAVLLYGLRLRVIELENALVQMQSRVLELENQCLL